MRFRLVHSDRTLASIEPCAIINEVKLIRSRATANPGVLMEGVSTERTNRRRSMRIVMRVPLYVSPTNAPATDEWESVETSVISMHGGLIRSRNQFPVGTTLDIRKRSNQRFTRGRVVWTAAWESDSAFEVGFEILDPPGFWEVNFHADRSPGGQRPSIHP